MRNMTVLWAGCLLGAWIALAAADAASAQAVQGSPAIAMDVRYAYVPYPYGHPCLPHHGYRQAARFGFIPVAPPTLLHGPNYYYGCPFYGPPYYSYPTPPLGCPGYAGFSGTDPNAYRSMVPPPIPTSADAPTNRQPTPAAEELPAPPMPREPIPAPPSEPKAK
jgi:hypothetical protein